MLDITTLTDKDKSFLNNLRESNPNMTPQDGLGRLENIKLQLQSNSTGITQNQSVLERQKSPGIIERVTTSFKDTQEAGIKKFQEGSQEFIKSGIAGDKRKSATGALKGMQGVVQGTAGALITGALGVVEPTIKKITNLGEWMGETWNAGLSAIVPDAIENPIKAEAVKAIQDSAQGGKIIWESIEPETRELIKQSGLTAFQMFDLIPFLEASALAKGASNVASKVIPKTTNIVKSVVKKGTELIDEGIELAPKILEDAKTALSDMSKKGVNEEYKKAISDIEPTINEFIDGTGNVSLSRNADKYKKLRNTDVRKKMSEPEIFDGIKVQDGKVVVDDAVSVIEKQIDSFKNITDEIIPFADEHGTKIKKSVLIDDISKRFDKLTPAVKSKKLKQLADEFDILPDEFNAGELNKLKQQARYSGIDAKGAMKSDSVYTEMMKSARKYLFESMDNLPIDTNGALGKLNTMIKDLINTQEYLETILKGKKVSGGRLTKMLNKTTGAVIGSSGGIFGAIAGSEIAGILTDIMMNKQLGNTMKGNILKKFIAENPSYAKQLEPILQEIKKYKVPQLPEGKIGLRSEIGSGKTIELPRRSQSSIDISEKRIQTKPFSKADHTAIPKGVNPQTIDDISSQLKDRGITLQKEVIDETRKLPPGSATRIMDDLDSMYIKAPNAKKEIDNIANEIVKSSDNAIRVALDKPKKYESAYRKAVTDYNGDATKISDLVRNTIIVDSTNDFSNFQRMLNDKGAISSKVTLAERDPLGFSSVNSKFNANGIRGEIQVNTPDMIYAKESADIAKLLLGDDLFKKMYTKYKGKGGDGHTFYEKWRIIANKGSSIAKSIAKESKEYYTLFR